MKIQIKLDSITPDRTQYKQYLPIFKPTDMRVEIDVPDKEVISYNKGSFETVLTLEGMAIVANSIADIVEKSLQKGDY
jgi:hypothetical protein